MRSNDGEVESSSGSRSGSVLVQPLSLASLDSSPSRGASGEEEKFSALPKPPLGRSNGDDRRQWRKQGGAVGAAASRMRAAAKQTLGAATRAVSPKVTERASPAGKSRRRSDRQAFCQSDTIAVSELFGSSLALSVGLAPASSPKGGAIGMSVRLSFVQPLSLLRSTAPLVGEPLAKRKTLN